jgi:hypothetical protein
MYRKLRFIKPLIGIVLIVSAIGAIVWWESAGREELLMEKILVAREDIEKGTKVERMLFVEVNSTEEAMVTGAIRNEQFQKIVGLEAKQLIPKNSQIIESFFLNKGREISLDHTVFPIKEEWIASRSSSLRKGDTIDIYDSMGANYIGTFKLAFVRDQNEQEIVSFEGTMEGSEILDRVSSTSVISFVEIMARLEEYQQIVNYAEVEGVRFLLVQREDKVL